MLHDPHPKKRVDFMQTIIDCVNSIFKSWLLKGIRIVFNHYLNPVSNISKHKKKPGSVLEKKISWIHFQLIELIKTRDFELFCKNTSATRKIVPSISRLYLNMSVIFLLHAVLFILYYWNLLINCQCNW